MFFGESMAYRCNGWFSVFSVDEVLWKIRLEEFQNEPIIFVERVYYAPGSMFSTGCGGFSLEIRGRTHAPGACNNLPFLCALMGPWLRNVKCHPMFVLMFYQFFL